VVLLTEITMSQASISAAKSHQDFLKLSNFIEGILTSMALFVVVTWENFALGVFSV